MKSLMAGIVIGMGGCAYLACTDKIVGSFLFSIGLISVLIFKFDLYTGWVCKLEKYKTPLKMLGVFIGNFGGAFLIGILFQFHSKMISLAKVVGDNKLDKSMLEWIIMSVFCGMFIAIAVYGWDHLKTESFGFDMHSYLIVVLGVMGFIITGSEHVVADIFYFTTADMLIDPNVIFRIILCGIGNMIGGLAIGAGITFKDKDNSEKL